MSGRRAPENRVDGGPSVVDMTSVLRAVALDVDDPGVVARFWGGLLDREVRSTPLGHLLPGSATQVGLLFAAAQGDGPHDERLHLHVTSDSPEHMRATIERALGLGGRRIDVGQLPEEGHEVLADPGGNPLCVIEPGSSFLAGCGPLGEVACDGTRAVGHFWRDALAWPLVWDQDEETAVQSPQGGTKVAWGGPPVEEKHGRNRQRFELVTDDLDAEMQRLLALGATHLADNSDGVELADPDGNEFALRTGRPV